MESIYYVPSVRGPLNTAKQNTASPLSGLVCSSARADSSPGGRGGLQCSSSTQALSIPGVSSLQKPLESSFPTAVVLQMGPTVFLRHLILLSGSLEWDWFWEEQLGAGAGKECCLKWAEVVLCLWLLHVLVSWSTACIGTAGWPWVPCSSFFGLWDERLLWHWSRGTAWHRARWEQANLCASVTADRRQPRCAEAGGTEPGAPWRKPRQPGCPTVTAPCWRAGCGTLLRLVTLSKQLAELALEKEGFLSHSHHENCSQERATWQQLPGICDIGNLSMVGSEKEVWMNYSVSTRFFPLGDPGTSFLLLSLPCWFCKSAACRKGPKCHLKISAHHRDLFLLGPYGASLPRNDFSFMCSYVAIICRHETASI